MEPERTTCVIAGGGPAGMVLGLLLARAGVAVTVLEKHGDFLRDFRGDTVHPSTLRLLDELGLGPAFARLPQSRMDRVEFPTADGGTLVVSDFGRLPGRYRHVALVPQWDLLDLLAAAGRAEPCFTLLMQAEVTGPLLADGRVVGVAYRHQGRPRELRADLTVAADGRWSVLRQAVGLHPHEYPVPVDTWWLRLPRRPADTATGLGAYRRDGEFAVRLNREGYYQIGYLNRKGLDSQLRAAGVDRFRARIAALLPEFADRVDAIGSMDDVKLLDVRLNRLRRWHVDGLLCIGDAAHAMSPIGGVGINLAVQDAVGTARLLAGPLRAHRVGRADLARVQRRRVPPTVAIQALQRMLHAGLLRAPAPGRPAGRSAAPLGLLRRYPALRLVPAYLIGFGLRPEHAPAFARRTVSGR